MRRAVTLLTPRLESQAAVASCIRIHRPFRLVPRSISTSARLRMASFGEQPSTQAQTSASVNKVADVQAAQPHASQSSQSAATATSTPSVTASASTSSVASTSNSTPRSSIPRRPIPSRRRRSNRPLLLGLGAFTLACFSLPFYMYYQQSHSDQNYHSDKPLKGMQLVRGAYINSSTRDIGPDPEWQKRWGIKKDKE